MLHIVVGAVALGAVVYGMLDGETRRQHDRFQRKEHQLRRESQYCREKINAIMQHNAEYQDYKRYIEMHYASVQTANQVFELYASVKHVMNNLYIQLQASGTEIGRLKAQRDVLKGNECKEVRLQLQKQREIHQTLKDSIAQYKVQKENYYAEMKQLNEATAQLKQYIRLNTGKAGQLWYERLEQRRLGA